MMSNPHQARVSKTLTGQKEIDFGVLGRKRKRPHGADVSGGGEGEQPHGTMFGGITWTDSSTLARPQSTARGVPPFVLFRRHLEPATGP